MHDLILTIKNLHVFYGGIHALKGISLEVRRGEIVTLIGANGAGKSTLLRTISGLEEAKEGSVVFQCNQGHLDLTTIPPHQIVAEGVCQVPEGRIVFANLTVKENLDLGAYRRKDKPGIAADLEAVYSLFPRLKERRKQIAGTLSGGEQQMLSIGRALMSSPVLLLLDEPSLGIAPVIVRHIFKIIQEINQRGTTILLVEQNAHMALSVANRGYVMETGNIVMSGDAPDLAKNERVRKAYLGE